MRIAELIMEISVLVMFVCTFIILLGFILRFRRLESRVEDLESLTSQQPASIRD